MTVDLSDYREVAERIADFREKHPDGCLRPVSPDQPYSLEFIKVGDEDRCFVVYAAAAYRTPDDPTPGIGVAWEPFPGLTSYTKNSELMNAETSAWGRAIIAVGASDSKKIATKEDVERRVAEEDAPPAAPAARRGAKGTSKASGDWTMPFGKYKGLTLAAIQAKDHPYLGWLNEHFGFKDDGSEDPKYAADNAKVRTEALRLYEEAMEGVIADVQQTRNGEGVPVDDDGVPLLEP